MTVILAVCFGRTDLECKTKRPSSNGDSVCVGVGVGVDVGLDMHMQMREHI